MTSFMTESNVPTFRQRDLFGGQGEVVVRDLLRGGRLGGFTAVLACELAPGASVGTHYQPDWGEVVVVTGGRGTVTVDGERRPLAPGDVVLLRQGAMLALVNDGEAPLAYVILKAAP